MYHDFRYHNIFTNLSVHDAASSLLAFCTSTLVRRILVSYLIDYFGGFRDSRGNEWNMK